MHEAGIAKNILDIALENGKQRLGKKITIVAVKVGKMTAIDEPSLRFAFDALKEGTEAENAHLDFQSIPLMGHCLDCGIQSELDGYFTACPKCQSRNVKILSGNELEMAYIEVE